MRTVRNEMVRCLLLSFGATCLGVLPAHAMPTLGSLGEAVSPAALEAAAELHTYSTLADAPSSLDGVPFAACWDPTHPPSPEVMAMVTQAMQQQQQFNAGARWSIGGNGDPVTLTWSFVPDGTFIPSGGSFDNGGAGGNSELFARMNALFGAANQATWIAQFQACFDRWSALSGVNYTRVRNGTSEADDGAAWGAGGDANTGTIRIAMRNIDGGNGILAYNAFPQNGDMVIDRSEAWNNTGGTYRFLRNTVMHEHGHGLGFAHVCPGNGTKLMEPLLATNFDGPQLDEIRGAHFNYGDIYEPNASAATATDLGTLVPGVTQTFGNLPAPALVNTSTMSISDTGDTDYYKMTVDAPRLVDITVTPVGVSYLDLDQNANGSCQTSGTTTNALAVANLTITVQSSNGGTTWLTQDVALAGLAETINDVFVSPSGQFVIRVGQSGAPAASQTQLYRMTVKSEAANISVTASQGTFTDKIRVNWTAIPNATAYRVIRNTTNAQLGGTVLQEGPLGSIDDTTALPGVQYFYFIRAQQTGSTAFRDMNAVGASGTRGIANLPPTAQAGSDQTVVDVNGNGWESVLLNGGGSTDTDGTIMNYTWREGATVLSSSATPAANVVLAVGVHTITLTVRDDNLAEATDTLLVTVNPGAPACDWQADGCFGDFDNSGSIDSDDVIAFFASWDTGQSCADLDSSGGVDSDDAVLFFGSWDASGLGFPGC